MAVKTPTTTNTEDKIGSIVILSSGEVGRLMDAIKKDSAELSKRIHDCAVQCLAHAAKHGDTGLMRRLLIDVFTGDDAMRRKGLIAWMTHFSPMYLQGDVIRLRKRDDAKFVAFDVEGANDLPFWKLEQANEMGAEDVQDEVKKALKAIYAGTIVKGVLDARKRFNDLIKNTKVVDGQNMPKDEAKPFYRGDVTAMVAYLNALDAIPIPQDDTQSRDLKAEMEQDAKPAEGAVNEGTTTTVEPKDEQEQAGVKQPGDDFGGTSEEHKAA